MVQIFPTFKFFFNQFNFDFSLFQMIIRGTQRICSSLYLFPRGILLAGKNTGVPISWLGNLVLIEVLAGNY